MQGQGPVTKWKEGLLGACLGYTWPKYPLHELVFLFDLYAGSGRNVQGNIVGSPEIMRRQGVKSGRSFVLVANEKNRARYKALKSSMTDNLELDLGLKHGRRGRLLIWNADSAELVSRLPAVVSHFGSNPARTSGFLLCDLNGCGGRDSRISTSGLRTVLRQMPMLDFMLHVSGFDRVRAYWQVDHSRLANRSSYILSSREAVDLDPSRKWLISCQNGTTPLLHMVMFGSHRYVPSYERLGLYRLEESRGREMVKKADGALR